MSALLIADELADAYDELSELRAVNTMPPPPDPDTVRAAEAARHAAVSAEARAATAELAAKTAQQRLAALEGAAGGPAADEVAAGLEALSARVAALAERIERERA
jgi:hypothetical protein